MCLEIMYLMYMYEKDLALNNLHWLIYHKTIPKILLRLQEPWLSQWFPTMAQVSAVAELYRMLILVNFDKVID